MAVSDVGWLLLTGALTADFEALRAKNHSSEARRIFVDSLKNRLRCNFDDFDQSVIEARSNLDYKKLAGNLAILDFDISPIVRSRIRLDKQLVGWRHGIAHGNAPNLSGLDIADHITFTSNLLLSISDLFQEAILNRV